jgi:hypothetical protein
VDNIIILNAYSLLKFDFELISQHPIKNCLKTHFIGRRNIWVALRSWLITHIRKPYVAYFVNIFVLKTVASDS